MHLNILNFDDIFNPDYVISSIDYVTATGKSKEKFNDNGLFSEKIFGENSDDTPIDRIGWIVFDGFKIISPLFYERLKKIFKNKALNKMLSYETKTDKTGAVVDSEEVSYFVKPNKDGTKPDVFDPQNIGIPGFIAHFKEIIDLYGNKEVPEYAVVMNAYEKGLLFIDKFPVISAKLRPAMIIKGSKNKNGNNNRATKTTVKFDDINGKYNFMIKNSNMVKGHLHTLRVKNIDELNEQYEKGISEIVPLKQEYEELVNKIIEKRGSLEEATKQDKKELEKALKALKIVRDKVLEIADLVIACYGLIYSIQERSVEVVKYIIDNFMKEKKGIIRKLIASTRVNYSARNVLTPRLKGNINDVELPYLTFLELFRFPLTNMIVHNEGITYNEAEDYLQNCKRHFDKKMYNYMKELIKGSKWTTEDGEEGGGIAILLNRNP